MKVPDRDGNRTVTVFGGTGFVGRRIVNHLRDHEFLVRIASRHPERTRVLFGEEKKPRPQPTVADIHDDASVAAAIADGYGVVNAVSLYVERGTETFQSVHVTAAARIARHARDSGVRRLVHISGIGADTTAHSPYICSRGRGWSRPSFPMQSSSARQPCSDQIIPFSPSFCNIFADFQRIRCFAAEARNCSQLTLRS